jgi:hypothetical protein
VEERADMPVPQVGDTREIELRVECATQRAKRNPASVPKALRLNGLNGEAAACEARWAGMRCVALAGPEP